MSELHIDYISLIREKLNLTESDYLDISLLGGMTNRNYLLACKKGEFVLRVPGAMTDNFVSRQNEALNSQAASNYGVNVETLFFDTKSGIKITRFLSECENLNHETIKREENLARIAEQLAAFHCSGIAFANRFNAKEELEKYLNLLNDRHIFLQFRADMPQLLAFFHKAQNILNNTSRALVCCHNDPVPENMLLKDERIYLIDWEYSGMNDPLFDLAALFLEGQLDVSTQEFFLSYYLKQAYFRQPENEIYRDIALHQFCQDVLWFAWTLVKSENGETFGDYGDKRISRAVETMRLWQVRWGVL